MGVVLIVNGGEGPIPLPSVTALSERENREEGEMAWKGTEEGELPSCTSPLLSDV